MSGRKPAKAFVDGLPEITNRKEDKKPARKAACPPLNAELSADYPLCKKNVVSLGFNMHANPKQQCSKLTLGLLALADLDDLGPHVRGRLTSLR